MQCPACDREFKKEEGSVCFTCKEAACVAVLVALRNACATTLQNTFRTWKPSRLSSPTSPTAHRKPARNSAANSGRAEQTA